MGKVTDLKSFLKLRLGRPSLFQHGHSSPFGQKIANIANPMTIKFLLCLQLTPATDDSLPNSNRYMQLAGV